MRKYCQRSSASTFKDVCGYFLGRDAGGIPRVYAEFWLSVWVPDLCLVPVHGDVIQPPSGWYDRYGV